ISTTSLENVSDIITALGRGSGNRRLAFSLVSGSYLNSVEGAKQRIRQQFKLAREKDVAVLVDLLDVIHWNTRTDLWNWFDPNKPGYNPENIHNVEWSCFDPSCAMKDSWRDWGSGGFWVGAPAPNLESPKIRAELQKSLQEVTAVVKQEVDALEREGKGYLFAGVDIAQEASVGTNNACDKKSLDLEEQCIGFRSYMSKKCPTGNPICITGSSKRADFNQVAVSTAQRYSELLAKTMFDAGISKEKIYTHGTRRLYNQNPTYFPASFTSYSIPTWSAFVPRHRIDTEVQQALKAHGSPPWALGDTMLPNLKAAWTAHLNQVFDNPDAPNGQFINIHHWDLFEDSDQGHAAVRDFLEGKNIRSDSVKPSVAITTPINGSSVKEVVNIQASASDDNAVAGVDFFIDGIYKATSFSPSGTSGKYIYRFETATVPNGNHVIVARAYDASNNAQESSVTVKVSNTGADTTPPTVKVIEPADGSTVSDVIKITSSAIDNMFVDRVEFYVDGVLQTNYTDYATPYNARWDTRGAMAGSHAIKVIAYDKAGNTAEKAITVSVNNIIAPYVVRQRVGFSQFITFDPRGAVGGTQTFNNTYKAFIEELDDPKATGVRVGAWHWEVKEGPNSTREMLKLALQKAAEKNKYIQIVMSSPGNEMSPWELFKQLESAREKSGAQPASEFVRSAFVAVLDRTPTISELSYWTSQLTAKDSQGFVLASKWEMYNSLLNSEEYRTNSNSKPHLYEELDACTGSYTSNTDKIFVARAYKLHFNQDRTGCYNFTKGASDINETQNINKWADYAKNDISYIIPAGASVEVSMLTEADLWDIENGATAEIVNGTLRSCNIPSPIVLNDREKIPLYAEYMRKRANVVRENLPPGITLTAAQSSTRYDHVFKGCRLWKNVVPETLADIQRRGFDYFDGLAGSIGHLSVHYYPQADGEISFIKNYVNELASRYPSKMPVVIAEVGYSTGGCTADKMPLCAATEEQEQKQMLGKAFNIFKNMSNVPLVSVFYAREYPHHGVKYLNGTPRPAYAVIPATRDIHVAAKPSWCTKPYLELGKWVCDWREETRLTSGAPGSLGVIEEISSGEGTEPSTATSKPVQERCYYDACIGSITCLAPVLEVDCKDSRCNSGPCTNVSGSAARLPEAQGSGIVAGILQFFMSLLGQKLS
ncbi:MAG: Ig-like domain-containing protein, partial [Candidatus Aenigmarchaeota archaeon]|nr:Ig-like domain-containing protein [Candidatus Aenigmarchaeota archaeon]